MPCHTNKGTQFLLSYNFWDKVNSKIWPSISPDYNPHDYSVWSAVERPTKLCVRSNMNWMQGFGHHFMRININTVQKGSRKFRSCLESMVESNGNYIEYIFSLLFQYIVYSSHTLYSAHTLTKVLIIEVPSIINCLADITMSSPPGQYHSIQ